MTKKDVEISVKNAKQTKLHNVIKPEMFSSNTQLLARKWNKS